jgi:hypothetical protein
MLMALIGWRCSAGDRALFLPVDLGWRVLLGILALIALVAATMRLCPLNSLIGLKTCADGPPQWQSGRSYPAYPKGSGGNSDRNASWRSALLGGR